MWLAIDSGPTRFFDCEYCELLLDHFLLKIRSFDLLNTISFVSNMLSECHEYDNNRNVQFQSTHTGVVPFRITVSPSFSPVAYSHWGSKPFRNQNLDQKKIQLFYQNTFRNKK